MTDKDIKKKVMLDCYYKLIENLNPDLISPMVILDLNRYLTFEMDSAWTGAPIQDENELTDICYTRILTFLLQQREQRHNYLSSVFDKLRSNHLDFTERKKPKVYIV